MSFPYPEEKIALIDLDGTILDHNYDITCADIAGIVAEAEASGWLVGLSSDSAYTTMRDWRQRFDMHGPIIAERGALVEDLTGALHYDRVASQQYGVIRSFLKEYFAGHNIATWEGDPVQAIRNQVGVADPGERVALLNNQRLCSLGIFFRRVASNGDIVSDDDFFDSHISAVRDSYAQLGTLAEDINRDYGILIATGKEVSKRHGTKHLQHLANLGSVAMIGNSKDDFLGPDVAVHYAVQDATTEFKCKADYVASKPLTKGVCEILKGLIKIS
jgi:hydroxymethylpyrimidine pyrophosphatase-like HAD family hydrolase